MTWTKEQEMDLAFLIAGHKTSTSIDIARIYFARIFDAHSVGGVKAKVLRLTQTLLNVQDHGNSPDNAYTSQIQDTPTNPCSVCNTLVFGKAVSKKEMRLATNAPMYWILQG